MVAKDAHGFSGKALRKELEFIDLYFMGLGGQAPLLSILTFATAIMIYSLTFAPIAIIIGTIIVLFNGFVVYKLSAMFSEPGGYYAYAFSSLSDRLGFETGWVYLFYSFLYGSAYAVGGSFLLSYIVNIPFYLTFLLVSLLAFSFLVLGIKPSVKYAIFAASLEVLFLISIGVLGITAANFRLFNMFSSMPSLKAFSLSVLFAIGIPTGYGTIVPLSGESKKPKHIGKAVLGVIIVGGLLASFAVYGLTDVLVSLHETSLLDTNFPALFVLEDMLGRWAPAILFVVVINDTVLGVLAFMIASSRTIFAMSNKGHLFAKFSDLKKGKPIYAAIFSGIVYLLLSGSAGFLFGGFRAFEAFAIVSGLAGLFVHGAADASLIRMRFSNKNIVAVSAVAGSLSLIQLIIGVASASPLLVYSFFIWIILGFFYLEILDFARNRGGRGRA
ncbi:MAG: APC family permease [Candidatus Micrarchaeia archaeon]